MSRGQFNSPFNRNNSPDVNKSLSPDFIPFGYSSPLSSMKSGRSFNKPYNKGVMRLQDRSFGSPSSNGSSNCFSPNSSSSFGSSNSNWSGQYNRSNNYNRNKKNQFRNPNYKGYNSSLYFHCSMIENPWAALEKKLIDEVGPENMKIENKYDKFNTDDLSDENNKSITSSVSNNEGEMSTTRNLHMVSSESVSTDSVLTGSSESVTTDSNALDVSTSMSSLLSNDT